MKHYNGKRGKHKRNGVEKEKQNADIHQIKSAECGVSGISVNAVCNKSCLVFFGNARTPAVFHKKHGNEEQNVAAQTETEARKTCSRRHIVPIKRNGDEFRNNDGKRCRRHQKFDRAQSFFFSATYLTGLYSAFFLRDLFCKIYSVEKRKNYKRKRTEKPWRIYNLLYCLSQNNVSYLLL